MSKKTLKDSVSQNGQTAKTPDSVTFTTADKLPDFDPDFDPNSKSKKRSTKSIYNSPTEPASTDTKRSTKKGEKPAKKRSTKSIYNSPTEPASTDTKRSTKKVEKPEKGICAEKEVPNQSKLPNNSEYTEEVQDLLKKYKRSTNQSNSDDRYLSIITLINLGLRPSEICAGSGVPKTTLQNHLNALKKRGEIYKAGYGAWTVTENHETTKKRSTKSIYVAKNTPPSEVRQNLHMFIPESVRAHAFLFTLKIPSDLHNWNNEKREQYLDRRNIPYKKLGIIGGGQRLIIDGRKTHLTNKSIVIYDRASYFAEKPIEAKSNAVHSFISIIKKLERILKVELTHGSDYKFKVSRQHYALVKNALAQQYNREGKKLEVRSEGDNSLWFLIDDSYGADEAEGVHSRTGMTDTQKVQAHFNSVKETGATMHTVLELNHGLQQLLAGIQEVQAASLTDQAAFAADLKTHVDVQKATATLQRETTATLKKVADGVQDLTAATKKLTKAVGNGGSN
jgi:hypothetical protein